jgi:hypothetical protein
MADTTQVDDPEVLRSQMEQSREALAQKIEMLEDKVTETVETATANVTEVTTNVLETVQSASASMTDTVDSVTNAVQGTVESVRQSVEDTVDTVKDAFDLRHQMELHPWWLMGGAVALGYAGGVATSSGNTRAARGKARRMPPVTFPSSTSSNGLSPEAHREGFSTLVATDSTSTDSIPERPKSWLNQLGEKLAPEISHLESLAIGVALGCVRDMVADAVPTSIRDQVTHVIDEFTEKAGGKRIDGAVISDARTTHTY